jgi:O-antigen/teichoic acid export membrane protein
MESMLFRFTGLMLVFLLHLLLARLMGPKGFGDYTMITSLLDLLLIISLFGMDSATQRILPQALAKKEFGDANGFLRFSYRWILVASVSCSVIVLALLIFVYKKGSVGFRESILWMILLLPILATVHQASAVLRSFQRIKASMLPIHVVLPVILSLATAIYYFEYGKLPVDAVLLLQLAVTLLVGWRVSRTTGKRLREQLDRSKTEYRFFKWFTVASGHFVTSLMEVLLRQGDILMVGYLATHVYAGQYAAAVRITSLVVFALSVADYVYLPRLAAMAKSGKKRQLRLSVRSFSREILLATLPLAVLLALAGPWLLAAFGTSFKNAYVPLLILLVGHLFTAGTGLAGGMMQLTGDRRTYVGYSITSVMILFTLLAVLLPKWGLTGAALSSLTARLLLQLFCYRRLYRRTGIRAGII